MKTIAACDADGAPARRPGPLVIRHVQMAALEEASHRQFIDQLVLLVRRALAERGRETSDAQAQALVANGLRVAAEHGLTWESSMAGFIGLMVDCGETFYLEPELRAILADPAVAPDDRVAALFERVDPRTWARMAAAGG